MARSFYSRQTTDDARVQRLRTSNMRRCEGCNVSLATGQIHSPAGPRSARYGPGGRCRNPPKHRWHPEPELGDVVVDALQSELGKGVSRNADEGSANSEPLPERSYSARGSQVRDVVAAVRNALKDAQRTLRSACPPSLPVVQVDDLPEPSSVMRPQDHAPEKPSYLARWIRFLEGRGRPPVNLDPKFGSPGDVKFGLGGSVKVSFERTPAGKRRWQEIPPAPVWAKDDPGVMVGGYGVGSGTEALYFEILRDSRRPHVMKHQRRPQRRKKWQPIQPHITLALDVSTLHGDETTDALFRLARCLRAGKRILSVPQGDGAPEASPFGPLQPIPGYEERTRLKEERKRLKFSNYRVQPGEPRRNNGPCVVSDHVFPDGTRVEFRAKDSLVCDYDKAVVQHLSDESKMLAKGSGQGFGGTMPPPDVKEQPDDAEWLKKHRRDRMVLLPGRVPEIWEKEERLREARHLAACAIRDGRRRQRELVLAR